MSHRAMAAAISCVHALLPPFLSGGAATADVLSDQQALLQTQPGGQKDLAGESVIGEDENSSSSSVLDDTSSDSGEEGESDARGGMKWQRPPSIPVLASNSPSASGIKDNAIEISSLLEGESLADDVVAVSPGVFSEVSAKAGSFVEAEGTPRSDHHFPTSLAQTEEAGQAFEGDWSSDKLARQEEVHRAPSVEKPAEHGEAHDGAPSVEEPAEHAEAHDGAPSVEEPAEHAEAHDGVPSVEKPAEQEEVRGASSVEKPAEPEEADWSADHDAAALEGRSHAFPADQEGLSGLADSAPRYGKGPEALQPIEEEGFTVTVHNTLSVYGEALSEVSAGKKEEESQVAHEASAVACTDKGGAELPASTRPEEADEGRLMAPQAASNSQDKRSQSVTALRPAKEEGSVPIREDASPAREKVGNSPPGRESEDLAPAEGQSEQPAGISTRVIQSPALPKECGIPVTTDLSAPPSRRILPPPLHPAMPTDGVESSAPARDGRDEDHPRTDSASKLMPHMDRASRPAEEGQGDRKIEERTTETCRSRRAPARFERSEDGSQALRRPSEKAAFWAEKMRREAAEVMAGNEERQRRSKEKKRAAAAEAEAEKLAAERDGNRCSRRLQTAEESLERALKEEKEANQSLQCLGLRFQKATAAARRAQQVRDEAEEEAQEKIKSYQLKVDARNARLAAMQAEERVEEYRVVRHQNRARRAATRAVRTREEEAEECGEQILKGTEVAPEKGKTSEMRFLRGRSHGPAGSEGRGQRTAFSPAKRRKTRELTEEKAAAQDADSGEDVGCTSFSPYKRKKREIPEERAAAKEENSGEDDGRSRSRRSRRAPEHSKEPRNNSVLQAKRTRSHVRADNRAAPTADSSRASSSHASGLLD